MFPNSHYPRFVESDDPQSLGRSLANSKTALLQHLLHISEFPGQSSQESKEISANFLLVELQVAIHSCDDPIRLPEQHKGKSWDGLFLRCTDKISGDDTWERKGEQWDSVFDLSLSTEGDIKLLEDLRTTVGFRGLMLAKPARSPQILEWSNLPFVKSPDIGEAVAKSLMIKIDRMSLGPMVYGKGKSNGGFLKAEVTILNDRDPSTETLRRTASNMSTGAPSEYRDLSEGFRTTFGQPTELTMETDSLGSTALGRTCLPADTMIIGP